MNSNLINRSQPNLQRNLESINPNSNNFDFELWAIAVRRQMLTVFEPEVVTETKLDEEE
ncbi:hypothetical protein Sta7437_3808 [Stanieria cyanosphaera PCC 7437]|uniref:Uncharacterized protein n=1 Tax=Stanieria cyanosphaera (strain ATCC 29371 / PCC 7437) TaxID=111780 RepID=K9XXG7_STAC7|nr:hypothetical protein [Stanieria cyanosphaera]AFZ37295.1 hypothetical protein Sta7437_3808 [Stanieria cyanosphaera PCC 7437]